MSEYNEREHFFVERNRYKMSRYHLTKYRRLRKLRKGSGIPIYLLFRGDPKIDAGEAVTKTQDTKAINRAVLIGRDWWD